MNRTQEALLQIMQECADAQSGKTPGAADLRRAGVERGEYERFWPTIGEYQEAAGLTPNTVSKAFSGDDLFEKFTSVCKSSGCIPSRRRYVIEAKRHGLPSITTLTRRFGESYQAFINAYKTWLLSRPSEPSRIAVLDGFDFERKDRAQRQTATQSFNSTSGFPFLPSCLSSLETLAAGEGEGNVAIEFERRCGDAFRALGFEVKDLGQGHGRKADSLAVNPVRRTGFIIDAKTRRDGYKLSAEERKFLEYVNRHVPELKSVGCDHVYLLVIGSEFKDSDLTKLSAYLTTSPVRTASFIEARALMRIVNDSIARRREFTLEEFEREIFSGGIIR